MIAGQALSLQSEAFGRARHACAFFDSDEEQHRVLTPFVREGLESGDKAFYIVDPESRDAHRSRLLEAGIEVDAMEQSGQLEVRAWQEAYLRGQQFSQEAMLSLIQEVLTRGKQDGYGRTRLVANMEWALEDYPGVDDILEYETRLNYVLPAYDDPVICTYDLRRFGADFVMDMMRTHPTVLIGGVIQSNPFFVPPDEFLRELKSGFGPAEIAAG